jgi:guanylate kinase
MTAKGYDILLDIDVQGARQIIEKNPAVLSVFILPPSMEVLATRLKNRGTDSMETIEKRLKNAKDEIAASGMYRFIIKNDDLQTAADELIKIIKNG